MGHFFFSTFLGGEPANSLPVCSKPGPFFVAFKVMTIFSRAIVTTGTLFLKAISQRDRQESLILPFKPFGRRKVG